MDRWSNLFAWFARADVRVALLVTISLRGLCSGVGAIVWFQTGNHDSSIGGLLYSLVYSLDHFDTAWYTSIAAAGYSKYGSTAFMPLYPLLMRIIAPVTLGDLVAAGLLVSTLSAYFAFLALYRLAERLEINPRARPFALLVAALLPTSWLLMAGYTESLFLALTLWALMAAFDHHWGHVAVLGAFAAMTRQQGVLVALLAAPATVWVFWSWLRRVPCVLPLTSSSSRAGSPRDWRPLLAVAAPVCAMLGWMSILAFVLRAPLPWEPLVSPRTWNLRFTWPGSGLLADLAALAHPSQVPVGSIALDLISAVAAFAALAIYARRLPLGMLLYFMAIWCSALVKVHPSGLTVSTGRYMLQLLPLAIVPAGWLVRGGSIRRIVWMASGAASLIVVLWIYVLGVWVP